MKDLLQGNKTITHPITMLTPGDEQKKYKINNKDWSILWRVEVQSRNKRDNILFWKKNLFLKNSSQRVLLLES